MKNLKQPKLKPLKQREATGAAHYLGKFFGGMGGGRPAGYVRPAKSITARPTTSRRNRRLLGATPGFMFADFPENARTEAMREERNKLRLEQEERRKASGDLPAPRPTSISQLKLKNHCQRHFARQMYFEQNGLLPPGARNDVRDTKAEISAGI